MTSLEDDVEALDRMLDRVKGPVVLVAHAYAGAVIASTRSEKVASLVYVAAMAPDEGEPVGALFYRAPSHHLAPKLAPDSDGFIWLPKDAFPVAFAHQALAREHALLAAVQRPIAFACIGVPVGRPLWRDRPSFYLVAEDDRMIPAETQRFMAERMKAHVRSHFVDHVPMLTAPEVVVEIIRRASPGLHNHGENP